MEQHKKRRIPVPESSAFLRVLNEKRSVLNGEFAFQPNGFDVYGIVHENEVRFLAGGKAADFVIQSQELAGFREAMRTAWHRP